MNYTYLAVGFFILIIIAVIITIVLLNRGNTLDIIASLPNFKIYYPKDKTYLQLLNQDDVNSGTFLIGDPFWRPYVLSNNNDCLPIWAFDDKDLASSFNTLPPNSKLVKLVNVIYNETGLGYVPISPTGPLNPVPSKIGYLISTSPVGGNSHGIRYQPTTDKVNGDLFLYTSVGENLFTLHKVVKGGYAAVYIENGYLLVDAGTTEKSDTFQLVLTG
jgi:hypothetical protein